MIIESVIRNGTADIGKDYLNCITLNVKDYAYQLFDTLRKYEYSPDLMKLFVVGGGASIIKNFGTFDENRVIIIDDICATAKGYEHLAYMTLEKKEAENGRNKMHEFAVKPSKIDIQSGVDVSVKSE